MIRVPLTARRARVSRRGELGVEVVLGDVVVDHRVRREHEAVGGEQQAAGDRDRVAGADRRPSAWPGADRRRRPSPGSRPASGRGGRAGRAAAARGRARRCGRTARSRAAAARSRRCRRPAGRRRWRRGPPSATVAGDDAAPTRGSSGRPSSCGMSAQVAVDRHPGDAGPAGDLGERRTPPADVEDAVAGGVEVGVPSRSARIGLRPL